MSDNWCENLQKTTVPKGMGQERTNNVGKKSPTTGPRNLGPPIVFGILYTKKWFN